MANVNGNNVTVIDGATNQVTATVAVGSQPQPLSVAVNPVTNKIYVANFGSNNVTVIDGATNTTTTVAAGTNPFAVAVNPATNTIYVANDQSANVTVIDGATLATTTVATAGPTYAVAVNPVTNNIYVVGVSGVTVIDGATNTTTTVAAGSLPYAVAVNPTTNKIYVPNYLGGNVTVIDGATNTTTTVAAGTSPYAVAVNPVTSQIYVMNFGGNNVTVIDEQQVGGIPLTAAITPLSGDKTTSVTPSFDFTAVSSFSPNATVPNNLLFQVDTWQGAWTAAASLGSGHFSGRMAKLQAGAHTLFAYATDGQEATSTNTGLQSSPLIGGIAAYPFVVSLSSVELSPGSVTFPVQLINTTSAGQTVTLTNNGAAPLTIASIAASGSYSVSSNNCPASPATLKYGKSCQVGVTFTPTLEGPVTGALTVTDNNGDVTGSTQTVSLTGTGTGVTFTPNPLTVSQAVLTTSAAQIVTLTNTLGSAIGITSVAVSGSGFALAKNTCGASVPALGTCTISVTFSPTMVQTYSGSITVTDTQGGNTIEDTVQLQGSGAVQAWLAPNPLNFGLGGSTAVATLGNNLPTSLNNISISLLGGFPTFSILSTTCGGSLAAGATCTITVINISGLDYACAAGLAVYDSANNSPQSISICYPGNGDN